eukprot:scaffold7298_cov150-Skeletonema_menzelii.AAC.24
MKRRRISSIRGILLDATNSSFRRSCCLYIWLLFCLLAAVSGHGFLSLPRSRNFVAYEDGFNDEKTAFDPLPEDCPHCLNRGGTLAACGVINPDTFDARNYDHPMSAIGYPLPANSQASYIERQVITVEVFLSEHQKGHMIFSACPSSDQEIPTQECFNKHRLKFVKDEFYGAPVDTNFPERVMVAPSSLSFRKSAFEDKFSSDTTMLFRFQLELPPDLTGQLVLLQWYYVESNGECMHEGYDQYPWPQAWIDSAGKGEYYFDGQMENCADVLPSDGVTDESSQLPKQFWNCAEVSISPRAPTVEAKQEQLEKEKTIIGYYASWQFYDRTNFAVPSNFDFTKYTRINFAFFQTNADGAIWGTDEWADPITLFGEHDWAALDGREYCSWDGPNLKTCNRHFYEDGLIYQAKAAGAEVWPSIGGWSLSDPFPTMAASELSRENFANNCVKLIEEYGFDGIDIDWEYPGYEAHSGTPEDKGNYNLLLQKIREKLDVLGEKSGGKFYGLTAALPCGTNHITNIDIKTVSKYLSELNLMTYDFFGAWSPTTGTNAPLHDQSWGGEDTKGFSIDGCTKNWVAGGGDPSKINIGLPFYGRSFRGATGLNQEHDGKADDGMWHADEGSPQYFNIVEKIEYKNPWSTDQQMHVYRHEETSTQYAWYNIYGGTGLVSYDDEEAICDKTQYCMENQLNGFIIWEISGDLMLDGSTPLIDTVHKKLRDADLDCRHLRYEGTLTPPSVTPTNNPSLRPSPRPTPVATPNPTKFPTNKPSVKPVSNSQPTSPPSKSPTRRPSPKPIPKPSSMNVVESIQSFSTSIQIITSNPTTIMPSPKPTAKPIQLISSTKSPTQGPSPRPITITKVPTPRPTVRYVELTPRPTNRPTLRPSPSSVRIEMNANAMASSFVTSASAFVSPTPYSPPKPQTPRPTRRPTRAPTPRLPNTSELTQLSVPMKGEDPKLPLNPLGSSSLVESVKTQSQIRPMKKKAGKKKNKQKIVPQQFNAAKKKGKKKAKKRFTQ